MLTKSVTIEAIDDSGVGLAKIAQLSAVDAHGDTYAPGAFAWKDQWAYIVPAHSWAATPIGKVRVYEEGDWAMADLRLNLATEAGKDWHSTLKFDLATGNPVQEWSYGYDVLDAGQDQRGGATVRVLKKLDVIEVSPVLRGAGLGTRTLSIKNAEMRPEAMAALIAHLDGIAATDPASMSASGRKQLRDIHASIGTTLAALDKPVGDDSALAGYLLNMSRRHLAA